MTVLKGAGGQPPVAPAVASCTLKCSDIPEYEGVHISDMDMGPITFGTPEYQ